MEDIGKLRLHCILHWDLNHFVVLSKVSGGKATILDPAIGKRVLPFSEVSDHFTGVALELTPGTVSSHRRPRPPFPCGN